MESCLFLIDEKLYGSLQGLYGTIFSENWYIIDLNQVFSPKSSFPPFHTGLKRSQVTHYRSKHSSCTLNPGVPSQVYYVYN